MKYTYFKFENFKGIKSGILDFRRNPNSKVFTLVGLNESGKTTILEAINYFKYNPESLSALELQNYEVTDIHNLVPIGDRDNFNGNIMIQAGIELDDSDIKEIKKAFKEEIDLELTDFSNQITYTQKYYFENSIHKSEKDELLWSYDFSGKKGRQRKVRKLNNADALVANEIIKKRLPSILYFPNFLFEFPERIYLDTEIASSKDKYYQTLIQDILDSLSNNTNIETHITKRILSNDDIDRRNLNSLIGKMEGKLTSVIFSSWNQILNKQIKNTEVKLLYGKDEQGAYLEFNIKDDIDTYRITERSLGFRWFFVYVLLTQFRTYRKDNKNVLFLFDEPAFNLHPSAQSELLKSFENLTRVLYSTHSHYLINPNWLESTYVIKNEAIDYEKEELYDPKKTDIKIFKYRNFVSEYPDETSFFQPILDVLDYRPSKLDLVPNSIICEGKNDYYTYNWLNLNLENRYNEQFFIPCTGSSKMENLISLFLGWGKNFIVLLDSDQEGEDQKRRYIEEYGLALENIIFTYKDIKDDWTNYETESLFSKEQKLKIIQHYHPEAKRATKKSFNRTIQELNMNSEKLDLEKETISNFERVFKFVEEKFNADANKR